LEGGRVNTVKSLKILTFEKGGGCMTPQYFVRDYGGAAPGHPPDPALTWERRGRMVSKAFVYGKMLR